MKRLPGFDEAQKDCEAVGARLTDDQYRLMEEFSKILERENRTTNLMGPSEAARIWPRHLLESVAYAPMLDPSREVIDVGSGAGFPGMVLAIIGFEVLMLEPRRKRFEFLGNAAAELGLGNARTRRRKLLSCGPFPAGTQFVARSVLKPETLLGQMMEICPVRFSCTRRYGPGTGIPESAVILDLPSPPLDRPGVMVQFRHPD